jgi:CO/xanthine dehydrogenase Mo-binding subunit
MPVRVSALRALGATANVFAIESFMDELAAAAGADPVEFRLRHLKDPRARAVIETVAARAGWRKGAKGDGSRGRGIGFARYKNGACYVAVIVDVEVGNEIAVKRAWAAIDAGLVINPDGLVNQTEGGIIQTVSWALKEAIQYDRHRILTSHWNDYPILTFEESPTVEVTVVNRPDQPPLGAGEGAQGPTVAAIANAVHHAMGVRLRDMPFTRERVLAALA